MDRYEQGDDQYDDLVDVSPGTHDEGDYEDDTRMDSEQFASAVNTAIDGAVNYMDMYISPERLEATQYYNGEPLGNEQDGRSQVVMTETRDVVQSMMPSLLRIFAGAEEVCEFIPDSAEKVIEAEQKTRYAKTVFMQDNNGFTILYNAFKDGLIRKHGVIRWYWDTSYTVTEDSYFDLMEDQLRVFENDEEVEIVSQYEHDGEVTLVTEDGVTQERPSKLYDIDIIRRKAKGCIRVEAIPPEEFLISMDAKGEDDAGLIGHRSMKTRSELMSLGVPRDILAMNGADNTFITSTTEASERMPNDAYPGFAEAADESMERVLYIDCLVRIDADGDGIAELHHVCTIGDDHRVVHDELVTDVGYAILCPDPEPHTAIGSSIADQTKDIQDIKTSLMRSTLDSLAASIFPRTTIVEGMVNVDDALNTDLGAVIRQKQPGMVDVLTVPFTGDRSLSIMQYMDDVRAARTGMSRSSQGLDPDQLQSTHPDAIHNTQVAAEQRLEMVARIFAETALPRVFSGIVKLAKIHSDMPRAIKIDGQFVMVDPKGWDDNCHMTVDVALGQSNQRKIAILTACASKQQEILEKLGLENPLVSLEMYRNTLTDILKLNQVRNTDRYFKSADVVKNTKMPPPVDSPEMLMAKASQAQTNAEIEMNKKKVNKDIDIANQRIILDQQTLILKDDRERDKQELDAILKALEIQAKFGVQADLNKIFEIVSRNRGKLPDIPMIPKEQPQPDLSQITAQGAA